MEGARGGLGVPARTVVPSVCLAVLRFLYGVLFISKAFILIMCLEDMQAVACRQRAHRRSPWGHSVEGGCDGETLPVMAVVETASRRGICAVQRGHLTGRGDGCALGLRERGASSAPHSRKAWLAARPPHRPPAASSGVQTWISRGDRDRLARRWMIWEVRPA